MEDKKKEKVEKTEKGEKELYEVSFHLVPTVAEGELDAEVSGIRSIIEKAGGTFVMEEWPKHFSLSYTLSRKKASKMEKFDTAYFGWIQFNCSPEGAVKVDEAMKSLENVLRYLIVRTVKYTPPSKPRSVLAKDSKKVVSDKPVVKKEKVETPASREEMDKEIDKLVVG